MANIRTDGSGGVAKPIFAGALVVCVVLAGFSAWRTWTAFRRFDGTTEHDARLRELVGILAEADAVQTATARAAVTTWDLQWEDQFRRAAARSASCFEELLELSRDTELSRAVAQAQAANSKMVATAELALDLSCRGRRTAARELLTGDEFLQQQNLYRELLGRVRQRLLDNTSLAHQSFGRQIVLAVAVGLATLPFLLVGYVGVWRNPGPVRPVGDQRRPRRQPVLVDEAPCQGAAEQEPAFVPLATNQPDDWATPPPAMAVMAVEAQASEGEETPADNVVVSPGTEAQRDDDTVAEAAAGVVHGETEASDSPPEPASDAAPPVADGADSAAGPAPTAPETSEAPNEESAGREPTAKDSAEEEPVAEAAHNKVVADGASASAEESTGGLDDIEAAVAAADKAALQAEAAAATAGSGPAGEPDGDNDDIDAVLTAVESAMAGVENDSDPADQTA
jgi:hypothetical protein